MEDFDKYLAKMAADLELLGNDVTRIINAKEKEAKSGDKPNESAKDKFKKVSLSSLQQGTHLYKDKEEIKQANENPEIDFINRRLKDIFSK